MAVTAFRYCQDCGAALQPHVVGGEQRNHAYCRRCRLPRYDHPLVVVTCFVACGQRLLWVRRALPPQRGLWAIPGGYLEGGETLAAGAARELYEEAGIRLPPARLQLYMTGTITFINQVYVGFRASVASEDCAPGPESLACGFYSRDECPWDEVAYPQVNDSIRRAYDDLDSGCFGVWQAELSDAHYTLRAVSQSGPRPG